MTPAKAASDRLRYQSYLGGNKDNTIKGLKANISID